MTNSRATKLGWVVTKQADESINTNATLQDDDELKIDSSKLKASTNYGFFMYILMTSSATPDFKYDIELNGNTGTRTASTHSPVSATGTVSLSTEQMITTDGNLQSITIRGNVLTGSTPGHIIFRWAQNTSDAGATVVNKGSHMMVYRTST